MLTCDARGSGADALVYLCELTSVPIVQPIAFDRPIRSV